MSGNSTCLLKTAVANISSNGTFVQSNILFDEGSQRSFLTKGLADRLQVQPHGTEELSLSTFVLELVASPSWTLPQSTSIVFLVK